MALLGTLLTGCARPDLLPLLDASLQDAAGDSSDGTTAPDKVTVIDVLDTGVVADAPDAIVPMDAVDAGTTDLGTADTGPADTGTTDTGTTDTGTTDTGTTDTGPSPAARETPTHGSAVVLTRDDAFVVATNRTANSISVFSAALAGATPTATRVTVLPTPNGEPWAAVIANDDNTAYVILRRAQQLVRVSNLRTVPFVTATVSVGSEPTGLAISPTGAHVYVANWADGTVTDVATATMTVARTINLNPALAGTGALGPSVTAATTRPGLAHPRAIVVTNNRDGSDADETVYVTEFFAQQVAPGATLPADATRLDVDHRGLIYRFNAGTGATAAPITLSPFAATGFGASGCFPDQLYAAALKGERLFITSVCESPAGPVDAQQNLFAAVYVVNTTTNEPEPANHVLLTQRFLERYEATATAVTDTSLRRFPLIPNDISFVASSSVAYVSSYGSDAVFRVQFNADGTFNKVGNTATQHFIDLAPSSSNAGRLPIGVAVSNTGAARAVALNENSRNLSLIDLSVQAAASAVPSADDPTGPQAAINAGRRFFVTGLGRWSRNGQGWGSCEGCHPDGLTDNVTWTFAAGPRQTISLDGTFDRAGTSQRILNWTAVLDEVHDFESNTRGASGGVGALVHATSAPPTNGDRIITDPAVTPVTPQVGTATAQQGLSGATRSLMPGAVGSNAVRSTIDDWENIDLYVRTIRPPRAPTNLVTADVTAGRALFEGRNCNGCHGSPAGTNLWTVSRRFYEPSEAHNNPATSTLRIQTYAGFPTGFAPLNPPSNGGAATFRVTPADIIAQGAGGGDQINCVLRAVGTIAGTVSAPMPVAPAGVTVFEVRANGMAAQGGTGFNVPSLVGMASGAPYFHAGNARTLEEAFGVIFEGHHQAFAANFLDPSDTMRVDQIRQLTAFLLSIDDDAAVSALPASFTGVPRADLCTGFMP